MKELFEIYQNLEEKNEKFQKIIKNVDDYFKEEVMCEKLTDIYLSNSQNNLTIEKSFSSIKEKNKIDKIKFESLLFK